MKLSSLSLIVKRPVYAMQLAAHRLYEMRHSDEPWIAPGAVKWCDANLRRTMEGLEWGSGRSTRWYAERLEKLTSVEHDARWYAIVKENLRDVPNVDCRMLPLEHAENEPAQVVYDVTPRYVAVAGSFADESLDFVVVDGHYRQACIRAAVPKLRRGGLLLVDNADWLPYATWGIPADFQVAHSSRSVRGTTMIWRKP